MLLATVSRTTNAVSVAFWLGFRLEKEKLSNWLKRYNCIVFTKFLTQNYFQNLSLEIILNTFLKFYKFQPRYVFFKKRKSVPNNTGPTMMDYSLLVNCFANCRLVMKILFMRRGDGWYLHWWQFS